MQHDRLLCVTRSIVRKLWRGWLAVDWPSTGGVLNITAAVWTAGFHWWRSGNKKRTQNVSEYLLVLALCLVPLVDKHVPRLSALEMSIAQLVRRCTNVLFTLLYIAYFILYDRVYLSRR